MNRSGRIVGMAVFVLGVAILVFVFIHAFLLFSASPDELLSPRGRDSSAAALGSATVLMLIRIGLLFVMTLAGSLVAARGIQLYLGSEEKSSSLPPS